MTHSTSELLLQIRNICKQYPGVKALDDVTFDVHAGEIHCLVGENGAGKSTLLGILAGAVARDSGDILIDGIPVDISSPREAQRQGIAIIHQEFMLVPELSVAENIFLGHEPVRGFPRFIERRRMTEESEAILHQLDERVPVSAPVKSLSAAHAQLVEIAKALSHRVRILALDEPTACLTEKETANLFQILSRLRSSGVGIMYVSHRLDEIMQIADRVTILRDGKKIQTSPISSLDKHAMIRLMVGREIDSEQKPPGAFRESEILKIENLSTQALRSVSLTVRRGEVFGIAGLVGSGRSELARAIFGADKRQSGAITLDGVRIDPRSPRDAIAAGIALLTEDRNRLALVMGMSVAENISLANLRALLRGPFIRSQKERTIARSFVDQLHIRPPDINRPVHHLSGGNRQKVVLARWLFNASRVIMFDEPTVGIDIAVRFEIYSLIHRLAQEGKGIIVISSDLSELTGLCDRIAVMCQGVMTGILSHAEATQERIMTLATRHSSHASP